MEACAWSRKACLGVGGGECSSVRRCIASWLHPEHRPVPRPVRAASGVPLTRPPPAPLLRSLHHGL